MTTTSTGAAIIATAARNSSIAPNGSRVPWTNTVGSRDYPTRATRPLNSMLECGRIRRVFGIDRPDWRRSLSRVMADLGVHELSRGALAAGTP